MSVFKDKTPMVPDAPGPDNGLYESPVFIAETSRAPEVVRVTMTPAEARQLRMSNYPRYDAMDVHPLKRPRYGHGY